MKNNQIRRYLTAFGLCVMLAACETPAPPLGPEVAQAFVNEWAPTLEQTLSDRTEGASVQKDLQAIMESASTAEKSKTSRDKPPYAQFVQELYEEFEYKPRLVVQGKLSPRGEAVWEAISHVSDHVLIPKDYRVDEIIESLEELKIHNGGTQESLAPTAEELTVVVNWVAAQPSDTFVVGSESHEALTAHLLGSEQSARLKLAMTQREELGKKVSKTSSKLEYLLALGLARYSHEMKHFQARKIFIHPREDDYYNDPEIKKSRPDKDKGSFIAGVIWRRAAVIAESMHEPVAYTHREIRRTLKDVVKGDGAPDLLVQGLEPQHPQYRALIKEFRRYLDIVEANGWKEVKQAKGLKPGASHATIALLKERLQKEGYFPDGKSINTVYDADLKDAIKAYQETHQMLVSGEPHTMFWRSINVPAERRLEQIRINVQRWRDTNIRHEEDDVYVFINVADFHAEVWENQTLERRHRVIVGNNDNVCNPETKECANSNRTPVPLAAYIDRAIYNPFWNVTPRIRQEEIIPEVKKYVQAKYDKIREEKTRKVSPLAPIDPSTGSSVLSNPTSIATSSMTPPSGSDDPLAGLPYYDPATGVIDVNTTDPDHIPGWYAANHYEVMYPGKSWEYVRMTPGAHNALGYVKIIFPNYHDVYLHDTSARGLFSNDIRAYSHGCMRLHKPLEFAEWLLSRDNLYEPNNIPEILKTGEYLPIFLDRQIPVFVEYYTVRVDDNGRANFLADVYHYDNDPHLPPPIKGGVAAP